MFTETKYKNGIEMRLKLKKKSKGEKKNIFEI